MAIYNSLQFVTDYTVNLDNLSKKDNITFGVARITTNNQVYRVPVQFNESVEAYQARCERGLEHLVRQPTLFPVPSQPSLFGTVYAQPQTVAEEPAQDDRYQQLHLFEPNWYQLKLDF